MECALGLGIDSLPSGEVAWAPPRVPCPVSYQPALEGMDCHRKGGGNRSWRSPEVYLGPHVQVLGVKGGVNTPPVLPCPLDKPIYDPGDTNTNTPPVRPADYSPASQVRHIHLPPASGCCSVLSPPNSSGCTVLSTPNPGVFTLSQAFTLAA